MKARIYAFGQDWIVYTILFLFFLQSCDKFPNPFLHQEKEQPQTNINEIIDKEQQPNALFIQESFNKSQVQIANSELERTMEKGDQHRHTDNLNPGVVNEHKEKEKKGKKKQAKRRKNSIKNLATSFQKIWFKNPSQAYQSEIYEEIAALAPQEIHLQRILLLYPSNVDTPEKKFGRYKDVLSCYENRTAEPYLNENENKEKIDTIKKEMDSILETVGKAKLLQVQAEEKDWLRGVNFSKSKNYKEAEECFRKAQSFPEALYHLGWFYEQGYIGNNKPDYQKAAEYYKKAATTYSFGCLGDLYKQGYIGKINAIPDYHQAMKYFELSGNEFALYNLGTMYEEGFIGKINGQPDYEQAKKYFEKSAIGEAYYCLGRLYERGLIGKDASQPNYKQAKFYFEKSSKLGYADSLVDLGHLYMKGWVDKLGGKPNYQKAKEYFDQVIQHEGVSPEGKAQACHDLGVIYYSGKLGKPNYKEAKEYFDQVIQHEGISPEGKAQAYHALGVIYYSGKLGKPNYKEAKEHFEQSNLPDSLYNLGTLYEEGKLGDKPYSRYKKAIEYYSKSTLPAAKLAILWLYQFENEALGLSDTEQEEKTTAVLNEINKLLIDLPTTTGMRFYIKGMAEYYTDNLEDALTSLQEALALNFEEIELSTIIQEIVATLEEEATYNSLEDKAEEKRISATATVSTTSITQDLNKKKLEKDTENDLSKLELVSFNLTDSNKRATQPIKITKGKSKRTTRKLTIKQNFEDVAINIGPKFRQPLTSPVEFVFVDTKKKEEFKAFEKSNPKLSELLKDIEQNGWKAEGVGKPEVLKHTFNGKKGCISRRINQEDRIVYKPFGQGKILILAWEGHYKQ